MARVVRRDEAAFAALYDRHSSACYSLALSIVRDKALAEDVVQEAFLTAWRSARSFVPASGSPRLWLLMLAHRRAVDLVRREERRRVGIGFIERASDEPCALRAERRVEGARLREVVKQLPPAQREAIALVFYGGLTQGQVAARTGEPEGTVKSRVFYGLRQLRTLLVVTS